MSMAELPRIDRLGACYRNYCAHAADLERQGYYLLGRRIRTRGRTLVYRELTARHEPDTVLRHSLRIARAMDALEGPRCRPGAHLGPFRRGEVYDAAGEPWVGIGDCAACGTTTNRHEEIPETRRAA